MLPLPIESALPELKRALLKGRNAALQAPPGAGKTTLVPLALLGEGWLDGRKIVVLEPRRLAARMAARRMSDLLGERVGDTVGYRIRMENVVGPETRVEVVTEGILTRRLQGDPGLDGVGLVVFDEFHERSIHADLGMALCLEVQEAIRGDLRILAMSATLEGEAVSELLGGAAIVSCDGRGFPVMTHYLDHEPSAGVEREAASAVKRALFREEGDILVFLPGKAEIKRLQALLEESSVGSNVRIRPLYGDLPQIEQDRAIKPSPSGVRKVVIATSIAETSLTIEGVRTVVDAGLVRAPAFDPRSGMTRLKTVRVSKASADQRRGRAGRLGPGACCRLWTEAAHRHLAERAVPEILSTDLAFLTLELARWGVSDPTRLRWIDPPPAAAFSQAQDLLERLGALDGERKITTRGKRIHRLPLHPRLAHMILEGKGLGLGALSCELAALLSEREILRTRHGSKDSDIRERLDLLRSYREGRLRDVDRASLDRSACRRILRIADQLRKLADVREEGGDLEKAGLLLAFAYPDRIAQRRPGSGNRFLLSNGRGAFFPETEELSLNDYITAAHVDGGEPEARIFLAAPVSMEDLSAHFKDSIRSLEVVSWDAKSESVAARRQQRLGRLIIKDEPLRRPDPALVASALIEGIRRQGLGCLPWNKELRSWQARILFLRRAEDDEEKWPDVSDEALSETLEVWLGPFLSSLSSRRDLQRLDLKGALRGLLGWELRKELDESAPTHLVVPSGSRIRIDYANDPPTLAVRLQEMFGKAETPSLLNGKVPLRLHLLSPAGRPVQVTDDLANFWAKAYHEVKKDLKGRYPKHHWPEEPLKATPTSRAKPKKR